MSLEIHISGARELIALGRRLQGMDKDLDRELRRGLRRAAEPLQASVREEAARVMPSGYAPVLLGSLRMRTQVVSLTFPTVRIIAVAGGQKMRRDLRALNRGVLRHPVFGRFRVSHKQRRFIENPWVAQAIRPGFWTRPMNAGESAVRRELVKVMSDVADKITKG